MAVHPGSDSCAQTISAPLDCAVASAAAHRVRRRRPRWLDLDAHLLGDRRHLHQREILRRRAHFVRLGDLREPSCCANAALRPRSPVRAGGGCAIRRRSTALNPTSWSSRTGCLPPGTGQRRIGCQVDRREGDGHIGLDELIRTVDRRFRSEVGAA